MFTTPIKVPVASKTNKDETNKIIVCAAIFTVLLGTFVSASLELAQLVVAVAGAAVYLIFYKRVKPTPREKKVVSDAYAKVPQAKPQRAHAPGRRPQKQPAVQKIDLRQDSKMPVCAPSFKSNQLDEQIHELLPQITPSSEAERVAEELALCAKRAIQQLFPEVDVVGFASGDIVRGTAFGVAVPEVDIVASASPQVLIEHLQDRLSKGGLSMARLDARKLQKSAIRACTDQLVSVGGFKFRRSAFRGQEPKVTLMAPPALGISGKAIPVDFSVNSVTPLYNAALLTECGHIDARAKALILLVKRWAKDRGVCHAAKGHLAPYAWTVLTVYFMQVGIAGYPLLPALQGFKQLSGLSSYCSLHLTE
jgi:hypothetical protein